jgi:aspartyl-tRNA(Asn)/glutamyl-tRNA(Gln) amidotransferase subunit A
LSAAAAAAPAEELNLGLLHIGTDGAGSIRIPAAFCGIYGLKPSFGHVAGIGTTDRLHHQGGIAHAPGHRAEMRHRPERAFCGIYGLKPSFGRVPAFPPSPFGPVAHLGPMTHPAEAGFQPVDAAEGRRDADRAGPVGADMQEPEVPVAHLGPMTRGVRDSALMMQAISRPDSRDMAAALGPAPRPRSRRGSPAARRARPPCRGNRDD